MEIEIGEIIVDEEVEIGDIELDILKIEPEYKQLEITPSVEEQNFEGSYNKVTVKGDSDLIPENIKKDVEVFGVEGSAKTTNAKITNTAYLFYSDNRLDSIQDLIGLCEDVTDAQYMFEKSTSITELDLRSFDTSNVKTMASMFDRCSALTSLDVSNFNTSNVTNMQNMFQYCSALTSLDVSNFNTSNVTDMQNMFNNCSSLTNLDVSNFNTGKVTKMQNIFRKCDKLTSLDLSNFDTSNVTSMTYMFQNCGNLTSLDLSAWNKNQTTSVYYMFYNCYSLTNLDLSNFDMSNVINIGYMLFGCRALENLKGFKDLGKAYTQKTANYSNYKLDLSSCTNLTHESLMNVINNLYDLNLTYDVANGGTLYTQTLQLGSTLKAKLTAEEIVIATNKRLDSFIEGG